MVSSTAPAVQAPVQPKQGRLRWSGWPRAIWIAVAVSVAAITAMLSGSHWSPAPDGLPDPGRWVVDGLPALRIAGLLAAGIAVGFLFTATALDPTASARDLSPEGQQDLRIVAVAAWIWAFSDLFFAFWALADVLGTGLSGLATPGVVVTYAWEVETTRAYLISALLAGGLAIGVRMTVRLGGAASWLVVALAALGIPSLTGHAAGLGGHSMALVSGFAHSVAAIAWGGTVVALATHAMLRAPRLRTELLRFGLAALALVVVLGLSGLGSAATRLNGPGELWRTQYGRMILVKIVALVMALLAAWMIRRRARGGTGRLTAGLLAEIAALAFALGVAVILARTAFPRVPVELPSYGEALIGYPYPPQPTFARVAGGWHPDYVWLVGVLLAAGMYISGLVVLHRRDVRWPVGRTTAWLLGLACILWATSSGVAWYAPTSFALHMISHMVLAMLAPVLLVMGAPITLALRALPANSAAAGAARGGGRGPREWLLWLLHCPVSRFVTHPAYVLVVYTVGLYGLYFSPLYAWLMGSHLGHLYMQLHFLVAGYLFYWVVIGIDPAPRKLGYPARLILLMASLVIHTFFAIPMMMAETPMVADWYAQVRPPWLTDPVADTRTAGGIAWGFGEIPTLVVALALAVQWARSDDREARRADRRADMDGDAALNDYNSRLAQLNARDQADAQE